MSINHHTGLAIDGGLLIDKPQGITSAEVLRQLKRNFGIQKLGHCGTLDPLATGLLVVLCGKATRLQDIVVDGAKTYSGVIRFGLRTDSDDITGSVIESDAELAAIRNEPQESIVERIRRTFIGAIEQRPPVVSAIKVDGKRSYARARDGEVVELAARGVEIYSLALEFVSDNQLGYRVECSKGTYVRSLARDIGVYLGIPATLESIRRERSGTFDVRDAILLSELSAVPQLTQRLVPLLALVPDLELFEVSKETERDLRMGRQSALQQLPLGREVGALAGLSEAVAGLFALLVMGGQGWEIRSIL